VAILIIDDDPQMVAMLRQSLKAAGYENVLVAGDGRAAMKLFEAHSVRLIVTDIFMPNMDGMEVILKMRVTNEEPTPIIAISGGGRFAAAGEVLAWAQNLGIQHTFSKPINRQEFLAKVAELYRPD
jgi:DNA-binding response OmpR family regulator